jgi:hypothetical protein
MRPAMGFVSLLAAALVTVCPASARDLVWEGWGENAAAGSASEGTHVWVTRGLYERGSELGLSRAGASSAALAVMAAWEIYEVTYLDAKGVSVQDLAANTAGVLAGLVGLDVNYQYAGLVAPRHRDDKSWLNVPMIPLNETTYAIEIEHRGVTAGYAYLGSPGSAVIGTTSMPVHAGEEGNGVLVPYLGVNLANGFHGAAGWDGHDTVVAGVGYRFVLKGLGIDLTGLAADGALTFGASAFVSYSSVF